MPSKANGRRNPKTGKRKNKKSRKGKKKGGDNRARDRVDRAPVAAGKVSTNRQSRVTRITHRESLGPVISTGAAFEVVRFLAVNPALSASFPWLGAIAAQYETYAPKRKNGRKTHAIRYVFETRCSTATPGTVVMVTNYDAAEGQFSSLVQAEDYRGSTTCQPWVTKPVAHELQVDSMRDYNRHYCRSGAIVSGTDVKTYDVGNFSLILAGVTAGQCGELFVEYDMDFFDPRIPVPIGANLQASHIESAAGSATNAAPLTGSTIKAGSTIAGLSNTTTAITIPAVGRYLVTLGVVSTAITAAPTLTASTNVTNVESYGGFALNVQGLAWNVFDVTGPNGIVTVTAGAGVIAGTAEVYISQVSSGLTRPKSELEVKLEKVDALLALFGESRTLKKDEKSEALPPLSVDSKGNIDDDPVMVTSISARSGAAVASVAPGPIIRPRKG